MTVLGPGGKSKMKLKNLKPFIKDSPLVQFLCKNSNQQESMVRELEGKSGEKNFFLADPGSGVPVVIVTVNRELFGSCVSLQSAKQLLASYEEFRGHLSLNIVEQSWSE